MRIAAFKYSITIFFLGHFTPIFAQNNAVVNNNKMNVLFIVADDLNNTLDLYGQKGVITPNLDRLAKRSTVFTRAYCQSPLCNPSRSSFLTGRRPNHLKIWTLPPHFRGMYPKIKTLPQYFKEHGYYTVGIGKIFHNWGQAIKGDPLSWSEPQINYWAIHAWDWYVPGEPYDMHPEVGKREAIQSVDVPDEVYIDGRSANAAVNKLSELRETPFFLAVGFWKPHLPYNAPKKYWDLYDTAHLPEPPNKERGKNVPEIAYANSKEARSYTDIPNTGAIPPSKVKELRHGYLADISFLDANVGKLLDELDRLDLTQRTIIVFLSDNGYHAGDQGEFGKWTNFEVGTRIPLLISVPGITDSGMISNSIVELLDLYPTLVELCHLPTPHKSAKLDGVSIIPIIKDPKATVKSEAISQIERPLGKEENQIVMGSTIREENFRYVVWVRKSDNTIVAEELYDLSKDLFSINNLIKDPKYKAIKTKLRKDLNAGLL